MGMSASSAWTSALLLHMYPPEFSTNVRTVYNTDHEAWLNLWSGTFVGHVVEKYTPQLFCLVVTGFSSVDMSTLRITGFTCYSAKWILRLLCVVLWMQLGLFGPLVCETINSYQYITHSLTIFLEHLAEYEWLYACFNKTLQQLTLTTSLCILYRVLLLTE